MSDGEQRLYDMHLFRAACGPAVQPQLRRPAEPDDFDILPEHSARVPRAERLHRGFLCGESPRQVRNGIAPPRTIGDLAVGEDPPQEPLAVFRVGVRDTRDVGGVEPEPDDVHD